MKRILLTGASGFVGSHLRLLPGVVSCQEQHVDVRDAAALQTWVGKHAPDAVIHLAAQSNIPLSFENPLATYEVNFLGTYNLLTALRRSGFDGVLLYVGTGDIYGIVPPEDLPIRESRPARPRSPYAVSKLAAEALCYQWSLQVGFRIVLTRPFNHFGRGQTESFAISQFARQIASILLRRQPLVIKTGDLGVTRDFTDVRDVVRAYAGLLECGAGGEVYNVCSGIERSLRDIVLQMGEIAGVTFEIAEDAGPTRRGEQRRAVGNYEKLHHTTGWRPEIEFRDSLRDVIDYWVERLQ